MYLFTGLIKKQQKLIIALARPSLAHTDAAVRILAQLLTGTKRSDILSLQQYCKSIDSLEMCSQASLFGCSFSALLISNSRQRSPAGTQQCTDSHPSIIHTPSVLGALLRVFSVQ